MMQRPLGSERRQGSRLLVLALAAPPAALALGTVTGLGLARGAGAGMALAGGLCITLLPIMGLLSLARSHPVVTVITTWLWCALLLGTVPLYFPGERASATADGIRLLARPLGLDAAAGLGDAGARLVTALGGDRDNVPFAVPIESLQEDGDDPLSATAVRAEIGPVEGSESPQVDEDDTAVVHLPFERSSGGSLLVRVDIDGPEVGEQFPMIFDTGATYTTLSTAALDMLDITVPSDAPWLTLRTANGEIDAPLVLVDAMWLGDATVEWVTVAVCDSCSTPPSVGLLGLNVSGRFSTSLNHDGQRIELRPRRYRPNRKLDVMQWLEIRSTATQWWDGTVEIELHGKNRSRREIRTAVVELDCGGQGFAVQLDDIAPGAEVRTKVALPRGTDCRQQKLKLSRANWLLDRF